MGIQIVNVIIMKTENDPAGIWKLGVRCRSIMLACSTENIEYWFMANSIMMPVEHMGRTLSSALIDSTWSIVQRFHGFEADPSGFKSFLGSLIVQALFRHLLIGYIIKNMVKYFLCC